MSGLAHHEPPPIADFPRRGVCRLSGTTSDKLGVRLDPLPTDAPVVIRFHLQAAPSTSAVIADILGRLTQVAVELFPLWLPDGDVTAGSHTGLDRTVARMLAERHAAHTEHFAPFLAAVAEHAVGGGAPTDTFPDETRARGLQRILGDTYQRAAVILVITSDDLPPTQQRAAASAVEWLSNHGHFGVWLVDDALPSIDRFPSITAGYSTPSTDPPDLESRSGAVVEYPPPIGRPHPGSAAEQLLERHLAAHDWAARRKWNTLHRGHSLAPPIRVDLMWEDERCVVEIDGADHRSASKYADDRRRDNVLVLDAFAVLRFTNEEVVDDPHRVVATIEQLLHSRRQAKGLL